MFLKKGFFGSGFRGKPKGDKDRRPFDRSVRLEMGSTGLDGFHAIHLQEKETIYLSSLGPLKKQTLLVESPIS